MTIVRSSFGIATLVLVIAIVVVASIASRFRQRGHEPKSSGPSKMVWIAGGEFTMGTDADMGWPDERPAHRVRVDGFWMDETEVTNEEFSRFVDATGYITTAERAPEAKEIQDQLPPGSPPVQKEALVPGSLVFVRASG